MTRQFCLPCFLELKKAGKHNIQRGGGVNMKITCWKCKRRRYAGHTARTAGGKRGRRMTDREQLLQKIKKIQALAERGDRGEKESAAALLERLMKQHGISETELEEDRREIAWFRFKTPLGRRLLNQIIYADSK